MANKRKPMAFAWHAHWFACNPQKGITIKTVNRFEDIGLEGAHPYRYSQGDLEFEFRAMGGHEWRIFSSFEAKELGLARIATYIIEGAIRQGFAGARHRPPTFEEYEDLEQNISDGMLVLCAEGGDYFRRVPDFRVEFVKSQRDVPEQPPPKPSSLDNLTAYGSFESPLTLGQHKENGFIYKHHSARDPEKGIEITRISRLEEISFNDPVPYVYAQGDLEFEFRAAIYREWLAEPKVINGQRVVWPHRATYVIEESVEQGLKARGRFPTDEEYRRLIENIKEGMWTIETRSERSLRDVPDFRLEFVRSAKDAPKSAPRPER
jgi:hypothetical protein